jgi:glycosyltransferase involved in cell wall biosynthesis
MAIHYSIVIPVYNEAEVLPALYGRLTGVMEGLGEPYEIIFVNDGSRDASPMLL